MSVLLQGRGDASAAHHQRCAAHSAPGRPAGAAPSVDAVSAQVSAVVHSVLGVSVGGDETLMAAGLDSLASVELRNSLAEAFGLNLPATLAFDYPSISAIAGYIADAGPPHRLAIVDPNSAGRHHGWAVAREDRVGIAGLSLRCHPMLPETNPSSTLASSALAALRERTPAVAFLPCAVRMDVWHI
jgi:acyl carrier protein